MCFTFLYNFCSRNFSLQCVMKPVKLEMHAGTPILCRFSRKVSVVLKDCICYVCPVLTKIRKVAIFY